MIPFLLFPLSGLGCAQSQHFVAERVSVLEGSVRLPGLSAGSSALTNGLHKDGGWMTESFPELCSSSGAPSLSDDRFAVRPGRMDHPRNPLAPALRRRQPRIPLAYLAERDDLIKGGHGSKKKGRKKSCFESRRRKRRDAEEGKQGFCGLNQINGANCFRAPSPACSCSSYG